MWGTPSYVCSRCPVPPHRRLLLSLHANLLSTHVDAVLFTQKLRFSFVTQPRVRAYDLGDNLLSYDSESAVLVSVLVNPTSATLRPTDGVFEVRTQGVEQCTVCMHHVVGVGMHLFLVHNKLLYVHCTVASAIDLHHPVNGHPLTMPPTLRTSTTLYCKRTPENGYQGSCV